MSKVQFATKNPRFPVAEDLYGLFFEDINRSGDSGLYPEMLRNRSFEDSILPEGCTAIDGTYGFVTPKGWKDQFGGGEGLDRWLDGIEPTPIPAWYSENADMELDYADTLNSKRQAALKVKLQPGGSIYNIGYRGVPAEDGKSCNFYMFAKAPETVKLTLTIEKKSGEILAQTEVEVKVGDTYERYDASLTVSGSDYDAIFRISAAEGGEAVFGFMSLMPAETYKGHGLRKDLMEMLEGTHSKFLRFPGGCIVEGFTKETMMRFPNIIGPVWERPSHQLLWHYRTTNGLGYHEYFQMCEDLKLEPMYVINCGLTCQARCPEYIEGEELDELLQEACDAIDYATAPADSKWGKVRAEAGHPEPFGMKYVEIGNENHSEPYVKRYKIFYDALKEKYPDIIFISNIHTEEHGCTTEVVDEHYYSTPEFFYLNQNMFESYDRNGPEIFVGEYAVTSGNDVGNLYSALTEAVYLLGIERNQDIVTLTSYAPLLQNVDYTGWYPDLIAFNNHQTFGIPLYYVIQMMAANRGKEVLEVQTEGPQVYSENVGIPGFVAYRNGVTLKNVECQGEKAQVSHQIVGETVEENGEWKLKTGFNMDLESFPGVENHKKDICYVTFGEEASEKNVFEADVKIDSPDIPVSVTLWNYHCPMLFCLDETEKRSKEWSPVYTEHYSWTIQNGVATPELAHWSQDKPIGESVEVPVKYGEYTHIKVETRHDGFDCYIDGEMVQSVQFESHPSMAAAVTQDEDEVIVKIVNLSDKPDAVEIAADCDLQSDYIAEVLTADSPKAENDFEAPRKVAPQTKMLTGASGNFVYEAPAFSMNVVKLKK